MKSTLLLAFAAGSLLTLAGCANEPPAPKQDDRMGARAGVVITSHDMSRVVPTRPDLTPPAN